MNSATIYLCAMLGIALAGAVYTMVAFDALSLSAAALQVGAAVLLKVATPGGSISRNPAGATFDMDRLKAWILAHCSV